MSREQRRHDRYQVRMPVSLASGRQTLEARTVDISFGGFFVTCEPLPPARQLVKAKFPVAGKRGKTFELMAMPVFLDPQGRVAGKPGCGLQLFGVDDAVRKQWEQLVRYAQALPEASGDSSEDIDLGHGPSEDWPEVRREIWVHVPDHEALKRLVSLELARGRLHARCTTELAGETVSDEPQTKRTSAAGRSASQRSSKSAGSGAP